MSLKRKIMFGLLMVFLIQGMVFAQVDVEGGQDHPLLSRFTGASIVFYHQLQFDEYILPLGKWDGKAKNFAGSRQLEGKITRIMYEAPKDRSTLEIFRAYEAAVKKAGFDILFSAAGEKLGNFGEALYKESAFMGGVCSIWPRGDIGFFLGNSTDQRYLAAKFSRPEGAIYVAVFTGGSSFLKKEPLILVEVIECQAMEENLVKAGILLEQINKTGRALVYGIHFETNRFEIKPESAATLKEIAILLTENPKISLYVVGHTDDQGDFTHNLELSNKRAAAVKEWLVDKHEIKSERLYPVGVGPAAPVSTNETEEGRAKNRRVELVKRLTDK